MMFCGYRSIYLIYKTFHVRFLHQLNKRERKLMISCAYSSIYLIYKIFHARFLHQLNKRERKLMISCGYSSIYLQSLNLGGSPKPDACKIVHGRIK
jgi:hypothetical protein